MGGEYCNMKPCDFCKISWFHFLQGYWFILRRVNLCCRCSPILVCMTISPSEMGAINIPGNLFYVHPLPDYLLAHHTNPDQHTHIVYRDHRSAEELRKLSRQRRQAEEEGSEEPGSRAADPPPQTPIIGRCDVHGEYQSHSHVC